MNQPYDITTLGVQAGTLAAALGLWETRDDTRAQPEVTRVGHAAVDEIDAMLAELHQLRSRLISEIREHQDIGDARADALLTAAHRS